MELRKMEDHRDDEALELRALEKAPSERRLYRRGSRNIALELGLEVADDGEIADASSAESLHQGDLNRSHTSLRSRTSSGKSIRSRRASRSEYHEDLKPILRQGLTRNLLLMSGVILMGNTFLFGYNIGVLNQPVNLILQFYNETYTERLGSFDDYTLMFLWSLTTALSLPGGMIGAYVAGYIADSVGRKRAVMLSSIPVLIGAALSTACVAAKAPELLMIGRFIIGLTCGTATQLAPMYLMEISPFNLRGAFGTACQLFTTIGIFMSSIFGLREILGNESGWPYLLLINAAPALICLVFMPWLPDSPRFLMLIRKNRSEAEKALKFIRQTADVTADLEEMETEFQPTESPGNEDHPPTTTTTTTTEEDKEKNFTMMDLLRSKELRIPLLITIFLQVIQQLSGINAIFFYSAGIFRNAGVSDFAIQYAVVGTCAVNVVMTIIAVPIMDKAGRRPLLLYPMIVMIFILVVLVTALKLQEILYWMSYISIICIFSYVICFALGLGPIPSMIGAELFRQGPRPRAMSLGGLANWLFTLIIGISFELVQKSLKEYTFLIFLVLMIAFTIFVFFKVPETKNKTFEEIASQFQKGSDIEVEEVIDDNEDAFQEMAAPTKWSTSPKDNPESARLMLHKKTIDTSGPTDDAGNGETAKLNHKPQFFLNN